ncbi:nucleotidyltransferase domain-containing protein, partial [Streptomyces albidoflavus]
MTEVAAHFSPLREPWWIAGGYAVELAVGRAFRAHADIDVLLLREDQLAAQRALAGWQTDDFPPEVPSYVNVYFSVPDCDAALDTAVRL